MKSKILSANQTLNFKIPVLAGVIQIDLILDLNSFNGGDINIKKSRNL